MAGKTAQYLDGMGSVVRQTVAGTDGAWENEVLFKYDKLNRLVQESRPAPVGTAQPQWKTYFYDDLNRIKKTVAADNSASELFYNEPQYPAASSYLPGQTVRSRDAWGRERWSRMDALGRMSEVVEFISPNVRTEYKYDVLDNPLEIVQGGQRRKFQYDGLSRLVRQKLSEQTATISDAGVFVGAGGAEARWSSSYRYDERSNIIESLDARGVKANYLYNDDPLNRLQRITYDVSGVPANAPVAGSAAVNLTYETGGDLTRLKQVRTEGVNTVDYLYDWAGRVKDQTLTLAARPAQPLTTSFLYDSLSRTTEIRYPAQYGQTGNPRRRLVPEFDEVGRLKKLSYDAEQQLGDITYNAAQQVTAQTIGAGANRLTEEFAFDAATGLPANQKVKRANGERLLDLNYEHRQKTASGYAVGRTGQLTAVVDNLDRGRDRAYQYDGAGRLTQARGGNNEAWRQNYRYDRFGNRLSIGTTGVEALRGGAADKTVETENDGDLLSKNKPDNPEQMRLPEIPTAATVRPEVETFWANLTTANTAKTAAQPAEANEQTANEVTENEPEVNSVVAVAGYVGCTTVGTLRAFDFDGDSKADIGTFNRTTSRWSIQSSRDNTVYTQNFGTGGQQIAPADYDGDGCTDYAVWNPADGRWTIRQSASGSVTTLQFGQRGDAIVPNDFDGDGKADLAVFRPSAGQWFWLLSSTNNTTSGGASWGSNGDIPVAGDYDGDRITDVAVFRLDNGTWYVLKSSNGQQLTRAFGASSNVPVPGDYDFDGKTDFAVWQPGEGDVEIILSTTNQSVGGGSVVTETANPQLTPADYDGDGKTDVSGFLPASGTFIVENSGNFQRLSVQTGTVNELAIETAYVRRSSAPTNQAAPMVGDGHANLSYDALTNRITTAGYEYDAAGNLTRGQTPNGLGWYRYEYDAANRLVKVKNEAGTAVLQTNIYGADNRRLAAQQEGSAIVTYYSWSGDAITGEYTTNGTAALQWSESRIRVGGRLLMTATANGESESRRYHHPDLTSTRITTEAATGNVVSQQNSLPFGTAISSETTGELSKQKFTSYERETTGLDYAVNRTYDSGAGRFTQVDPLEMGATDVGNPQSLNLYAYVQNDPINFVDPTGLNASSSGGGSCWVSWSATAWYQGNEFLGITNFSYSVSCTGGSGGNSGGGNSGGGGNVPLPQDDKPDDELIHCDPAVKKQIEKLNQRIRSQPSSLVSREFGFEVERVNGKLEVKPIRMSLAGNEFVPNWNENVVWVIHSHPSIRGNAEQPSTADRNYAIGNKLIVVTTLVEPDTERSTLFNGNKPTDDKGKRRILDSLPNCPEKSKKKK